MRIEQRNGERISNFIKRLNDHSRELSEKRDSYKERVISLEKEISKSNPYTMRIKQLENEVFALKCRIDSFIST